MSYYKVKNISIKGNKLKIQAASNNVRSMHFFTSEYGTEEESIDDKIVNFFISAMEGNFQLYRSCRYYEIVEECYNLYNRVEAHIDLFELDWNNHTSYGKELKMLIANDYALKKVKKEQVDMSTLIAKIDAFTKKVEQLAG